MRDKYEDGIIRKYIFNIASKTGCRSKTAQEIVDFINAEDVLGNIETGTQQDANRLTELTVWFEKTPASAWEKWRAYFKNLTEDDSDCELGILQKNLQKLADVIGLDEIDTAILGVACRYKFYNSFENLCDRLMSVDMRNLKSLLADFLRISGATIADRLSATGTLPSFGLIENPRGDNEPFAMMTRMVDIPGFVQTVLAPPLKSEKEVWRALIGKPCAPQLEWEAFDHIGEEKDILAGLMANARNKGEKNINILLYGPPGTGKTEFCKTVSARLGMTLYSVGEADESGDEPNRSDRIAHLRLADRLLAGKKECAILFDEMEDLLDEVAGQFSSKRVNSSKLFLNRLIENNSVPTFWTCNHTRLFDSALLRRMSMIIEFEVPSTRVREKIWKRTLKSGGMELPDGTVHDLARGFEAPPSFAASAVRVAGITGGGEKTLRTVLTGMTELLGGLKPVSPLERDCRDFSAELINADADLSGLTSKITAKEIKRNFSLCLYGPPGSGKSFYLRYLADRMEMEVMQMRASDLLSMWVGGTEANIARAFRKAAKQSAFLIFDEADSLLHNREMAQQSWQVSQVNEMLTWMESHPLPFACTSNLMGNMDYASLRRFTFKVKFDYLTAGQARKAFRLFFNEEPPESIATLNSLTPADFAVAGRKAEIIGKSGSAELAELLKQECALKPAQPRKIRF